MRFKTTLAVVILSTLLLQGAVYLSSIQSQENAASEDVYSVLGSELEKSTEELELAKKLSIEVPMEDAEAKASLQAPEKPSYTRIAHKIRSGDNLSKIFKEHGESFQVALAFQKALDSSGVSSSALRVGEEIELRRNDANEIYFLRIRLPNGDLVTVKRVGEEYNSRIDTAQIIEKEKVVTSTITSSISEAALRSDLPLQAVDDLVDLFGNRIDFTKDLQPGDSFSIVVNEKRMKHSGKLVSLSIDAASILNRNDLIAAVGHDGSDGKKRFFNEKGELLGDHFLRYPLQYTRISSIFSTSRLHPVLHIRRPHLGVDFAAPVGTPVRAVADGIIQTASYSGAAGNMIKIKHDSKYQTVYMHLSKFAKGIHSGSKVSRGQVIGSVGNSGLSTGPHLDYRLSINGNYVDPLKAKLPTVGAGEEAIPQRVLASTLKTLQKNHDTIMLAGRKLGSNDRNV